MKTFFLIIIYGLILICGLHAQTELPQRTPEKTSVPSSEVSVPINLIKQRPYIRASINGSEPMWFLLDTGTTTNIVRDWVVRKANLPTRPTTSKVYGFGGVTHTQEICRIESLRLGEAEFSGFDADVQPDESEVWEQIGSKKIAGVLGFRFFADCLLTLDYPNTTIKISKGFLSSPNNSTIIRFFEAASATNIDTLPIIPIQIQNKTVPALIDSGFISTLTLPKPLLDELAADQPIAEIPQMLIYGAGGISQNMCFARVPETLEMGRYSIKNPLAMIAQPLGALKVGFMILGGELLENFSITFDQKQRCVRFDRSSKQSPVLDYSEMVLRIRFFNLQFGESFWTVPGDITMQDKVLQKDDLIFLVDHKPVFKMTKQDWDNLIRSQNEVNLTLLRNGKLIDICFPLIFLPAISKD